MNNGRCFVDSFESELSKKDHGNRDLVLHEIRLRGRFSTFEMTAKLMHTIQGLLGSGAIRDIPSGYPWHRYKIATESPATAHKDLLGSVSVDSGRGG